jgi:hypothetical protein
MRFARHVAAAALGAGLFTPTLAQDNPAEACTSVAVIGRIVNTGVVQVLVLKNDCAQRVICEVWTSEHPYPHELLRAGPGKTAELIMQTGALQPFSVIAQKSCRFE